MFASISSSAPMPSSLASHVFGRFMGRSDGSGAKEAVTVPAAETPATDDDATPDLAQRVREAGEW
ncbi:hypothetical protein [Acidovorax radicis]|uniref:hypothetical protein n=1 Tax=Acidovorax radicis TaxID=758826 RepID=UPI001CF879F0|nr:hypothetical protein [Acidovorax radicis]UCU97460.1 hypothetical protein KI609_12690 [Acidovorax radicis]